MKDDDWKRMVEAEAEALEEVERTGREAAYAAAREIAGTAGMLDVFDAAVVRTLIATIMPGSSMRRKFWADVKAEIER